MKNSKDAIALWTKLKKEIDSSLSIAIERNNVDVEVLKIMRELLHRIRIRLKGGDIIDV